MRRGQDNPRQSGGGSQYHRFHDHTSRQKMALRVTTRVVIVYSRRQPFAKAAVAAWRYHE
jgi:hypothetical protein